MRMKESHTRLILDDIMGYVVGAPDVAVRSAINISVEDYLNDIGGIKAECDSSYDAECGGFHADAPFAGRVLSVDDVFVYGHRLNKGTYSVYIAEDGCAVIVPNVNSCVKINYHSGAEARIVFSWIPSENTTELPQSWFYTNRRAIRNATLRFILSQVGNPWGNEALAMRFNDEYQKCVHDALVARHLDAGGQMSCFDSASVFCPGGF